MYNIAIVGTGNIAPCHIEPLLKFSDRCKIVALCDIYPEKAQVMKERLNIECEIFDDHIKMLDSGLKIDVVHICTPPYTHAEIAINSMNRKINILVEKPMATCLEECDAMIACEKENGVVMGCVAQNRFQNATNKLKQVLDSGKAGDLRCAHVNSFWWRGHSYYDLWWRGLWEKEGGGPTLNHAVHHIDLINWLKGGVLPKEVTSVLANVMHDNAEVEDLSFSTLVYEDSSVAQLTASVIHHGEEQGLVLQCADAKIEAPWDCYASISKENGFPIRNEELEKELNEINANIADLKYTAHGGEIDNYLNALDKGERPMIVGKDGRNTVELITAIYKSGSLKQTVTLPLSTEDDFYTFEGLIKNAPHFYEKTSNIANFTADNITTGNY